MTTHHRHHQEDDWEFDMSFELNTTTNNNNIFQRKGVFTMQPDKELDLACERYQYPTQNHYYLEDDDTNSSVTSGSLLSEGGKYSEIDTALNDLDDFMFDEPPPPSMRMSTAASLSLQQYDFTQFPGVVKRLGPNSNYQQVQDNDDWIQDIDMPVKGISLLSKKKLYNDDQQQLLSLDEDDLSPPVQPVPTQALAVPQPQLPAYHRNTRVPSSTTRPLNLFGYEPEKDDEDDDMTGLDFPENMCILPKRLDEKKRYNPPTATNSTTRIPISKTTIANNNKSKFLSLVQRENDDDDFCDGLNIKEKAFTISSSSTPSPRISHQQQQRPVTTITTTTKGKEPTTFISRLARPSPLLNNGNKQSDHAAALAKRTTITPQKSQQRVQPMPTTSNTRHKFLSGTKASRQREADIAASKSRISKLTMNKNLIKPTNQNMDNNLPIVERKSANGYTLIAKPKTKLTASYCARLDNIDNLNDLRPTRGVVNSKKSLITSLPKSHPKGENKSDPDRPWRRNMQTTTSSKVKLIQPNEQNLQKEYNDMTYDDSTHSWKGNEKSLIEFQDKPTHRRPMLIMNKQQKYAPSRYAAVVGSSMIFNTESQKWVSANGSVEECNELDIIEDLKDELLHLPRTNNNLYNNTNQLDDKLLDFKLSIEVKRQMMFEQEKHESWMTNWSIKLSSSSQQYF